MQARLGNDQHEVYQREVSARRHCGQERTRRAICVRFDFQEGVVVSGLQQVGEVRREHQYHHFGRLQQGQSLG